MGVARAQTQPGAPAEFEAAVAPDRVSVFFGGGSYYLHPDESARLRDFLDARPDLELHRVEVQGHTDDIGDRDYNLRLSAARAEVVRRYLVAYPFPEELVTVLPLGEDAPSFDNGTWAGKLSNRRVDVILLPALQ